MVSFRTNVAFQLDKSSWLSFPQFYGSHANFDVKTDCYYYTSIWYQNLIILQFTWDTLLLSDMTKLRKLPLLDIVLSSYFREHNSSFFFT